MMEESLADVALEEIRPQAQYGDIRLLKTQSQRVRGRDGRIIQVDHNLEQGYGVRVMVQGAWGFASSCDLSSQGVVQTVQRAVQVARAHAKTVSNPVQLAPEDPHRDSVATKFQKDPLKVPLKEKFELLTQSMEALHRQSGIACTEASLWARRDEKFFASTEGHRIHFNLLASHGGLRATALWEGRFASRSYETTPLRAGYELIESADFLGQAPRVAAQAVEKVRAPAVDPGTYDLVLDPEHLALTIHETCGHPSELDRALGHEANFAGGSFLTPDKLGTFQYGSPCVNFVADNTMPGGLASTGYDDDGVSCQKWDIIREGKFVGYCTNRETAPSIGERRSRGSNRADSWRSIPIVRIANVGLLPGDHTPEEMIQGIEKGLYIEGADSFSIDQQRYNFQFSGDAFWLIENGQKTHMLRDVVYHGMTPQFWGSCDAVARGSYGRPFGFLTCGKGEPCQMGWMTHQAPHARFRNVEVICAQSHH